MAVPTGSQLVSVTNICGCPKLQANMAFYGYHLINRNDPGGEKNSTKDPLFVSNTETHEVPCKVEWAQRSNCLYITVLLPGDSKPNNPQFQLDEQSNTLTITCEYEEVNLIALTNLKLTLFAPVTKEKSEWKRSGRTIVFNLAKKQVSSEYWPRLLNTKEKRHWLTVDQHKIVDEDEENTHKYKWTGGEPL